MTTILKPGSLVYAAKADLARHKRNKQAWPDGPYEQFAFDRRHVRRATNVIDLLRKALAVATRGVIDTSKRNTIEIYSHPDLIEQAIEIAKGTKSVEVNRLTKDDEHPPDMVP